MSEISQKVVEIIKDRLNQDVKNITPEASFANDLGADSLDTVELIMAFEDEFGVSLPDEEIASMKTVGDIVNFINKLKK